MSGLLRGSVPFACLASLSICVAICFSAARGNANVVLMDLRVSLVRPLVLLLTCTGEAVEVPCDASTDDGDAMLHLGAGLLSIVVFYGLRAFG